MKPTPVPASQISDFGGAFKKRTGSHVYLRISDSSARFFKLPEGKIYGVGYNGNITAVDPATLVIPCTLEGLLENRDATTAWEKSIGVKHEGEGED